MGSATMKSETLRVRERRRKATVLCNFIASAKERCVAPTATHAVLVCLTYSSTTLSHSPNKKIAERERDTERESKSASKQRKQSILRKTNKQTVVTDLCNRPNSDSERQEEEEEEEEEKE